MKNGNNNQTNRLGGIDPAALAAATLAAAVSTIVQSGPYTPLSGVVGVSILALIRAYDVDAHRTKFQSAAFAAVQALTFNLVAGAGLELLCQWNSGICFCSSPPSLIQNPALRPELNVVVNELTKTNESKISSGLSVAIWMVAALIFYGIDTKSRNQKDAGNDQDGVTSATSKIARALNESEAEAEATKTSTGTPEASANEKSAEKPSSTN